LRWLANFSLCSTPRLAARLGFCFGFGWFAVGISWVHVSIDRFGGLPLVVSLLLMLILCAYLALFPALAAWLAAKLSPKQRLNLFLLPPLWLVTEYLRATLLTGFPWLSLGYSQIDSPLANLAPVIGELGISLVLLLSVVSVVTVFTDKVKIAALILPLIALLVVWSQQQSWLVESPEITKVALVQGNIKQEMRWAPENEWPTMLKYADLTRTNYDAELIIWPEAAVPAIEPMAQEFLENINSAAAFNNSAIITGIINYNFESKHYFNSLIVLGKENQEDQHGAYYYRNANHYNKHHLLPIGEFVPLGELLRPLAPFFNLPMSSFSRGDYVQQNLVANGLHLLPLICFEVVFAQQLRDNFTEQTNMLMTVSNDAWFGDSHGPHQHLEIARMRALEFGRPMLRATNNGITAVIDHQGKIIGKIPQFEEAVLKADVQQVTGYTPYSQFGDRPLYLFLLLYLVTFYMKQRLTFRKN
jgi:apolipoprotein N-acyltransferase